MKEEEKVNLLRHEERNGVLCAFENGVNVNFDIKRVFAISASKGDKRGAHAHKKCSQLLVCVTGKILVSCNNGRGYREYILQGLDVALFIPPGIWAEQEYISENSLLVVMCDRLYEPNDYIRNYAEYKKFFNLG
jgi:dTDP-4-dehydrorhamnose 3,5-epimerase-like enzyme